MDKIQKNIIGSDIYHVISVNSAYWNLRTILFTFVLLLKAIFIQSAVAADNVVGENQDSQLSTSQKLKESSLDSEVKLQQNILRQRLLNAKKNNFAAKVTSVNISNNFHDNVEPEIFSNSFSEVNLLAVSPEKIKKDDDLAPDLAADAIYSVINNTDTIEPTQKQTNALQDKQPKIVAQIDSSTPAGDSFGEVNQLRQELLIDPIVTVGQPLQAAPGSTAGTPSAYGASLGQAYIGGGALFPLEGNRDRVDGSLSAGFGLGDTVNSVGLEVNINITSVGGGSGFDFGDSGGVGFKLHRYLGDGAAVAVGWSNPIKWGDVTQAKETIYGVFTKSFSLQPDNLNNRLPLTVSVGLGSGVFRSKGAIDANDNSVNIFGSVGLRVIPQVSLVSSWTGNRLNMGASFVPFQDTPIVINAIFTDVTSNLNTGRGFALSAGYVFRF